MDEAVGFEIARRQIEIMVREGSAPFRSLNGRDARYFSDEEIRVLIKRFHEMYPAFDVKIEVSKQQPEVQKILLLQFGQRTAIPITEIEFFKNLKYNPQTGEGLNYLSWPEDCISWVMKLFFNQFPNSNLYDAHEVFTYFQYSNFDFKPWGDELRTGDAIVYYNFNTRFHHGFVHVGTDQNGQTIVFSKNGREPTTPMFTSLEAVERAYRLVRLGRRSQTMVYRLKSLNQETP